MAYKHKVAQQEDAEKRFPQNKLFVELFAVSIINLVVLAVMAALGVYGFFCIDKGYDFIPYGNFSNAETRFTIESEDKKLQEVMKWR